MGGEGKGIALREQLQQIGEEEGSHWLSGKGEEEAAAQTKGETLLERVDLTVSINVEKSPPHGERIVNSMIPEGAQRRGLLAEHGGGEGCPGGQNAF